MILLLMVMLMPSKSSAITNDYGYQGTIELQVGETKSISLIERAYSTVLLGYYPSGKWVLSNNSYNVSMISQNLGGCKIRGDKPGSKIKLTFSGNCILYDASWNYTGYYYITVVSPNVPVTSIALNTSSASLKVGDTKQLSATVSPSNATDKSVSWSSSNSSVASVNSSGLVTAKGAGTATITCRANDGSGVQATCNVTVSEPVTISINSTNFPDGNFRNYLLEQDYGKDGKLTGGEIKDITYIWVNAKNISSLKGIELFTALTSIQCNGNQLTTLDISMNTALTSLDCFNNKLTALDVSKNTALTELWCMGNQLKALDVSKNTALTSLDCSDNQLTALDVSRNTALTSLNCSFNQLTALDVSKNTALTELECYGNNIQGKEMTALISSLPKNYSNEEHYFRAIYAPTYETNICTKSQVAAIKAKGWIPQYFKSSGWVEYEGSEDTSININSTNFPDDNFRNYLLEQSYGKDGVLVENEIEKIDYLLFLSEKNIISLKGIEYFTALTALNCENNQLTGLDVSKNIALTHLYCNNNQLTALDVSKNTVLKGLSCDNNQLTSLDISNTKLEFLWCCNNRIKGVEMDKLISSLPQNTGSVPNRFFVIDPTSENEGNVCTKSQVAAIKAKGWTPLYRKNAITWEEYEGSEDTSIPTKISLPV